MQESVILQGPIPTTGIIPLIHAVGIGRQTNIVELLHGSGYVIGRLSIRSGKLLSVEYAGRQGLDVLKSFVEQREGSFVVRSIQGMQPSEPLGDLRQLLQQLGSDFVKISLLRNVPEVPPMVMGTGVQSLPPGVVPQFTPAVVMPPLAPQIPVAAPVSYAATAPAAVAPSPAPVVPVIPAAPVPAAVTPAPVVPVPVAAPVAVVPAPGSAPAPAPKRLSVVPVAADLAPVVAIVSAKGGAGKTTIAMNLAVALARRGLRVTVVDTDPNGGIAASANAHRRIVKGAFDVICGAASLDEVTIGTRMSGLRVIPAGGTSLSIEQLESAQSHRPAWKTLLSSVAKEADIVIVDTAGGVYGPTRMMLGLASHVVGVLQSEPLAIRASEHFDRAIASVSPAPSLVGIAMNMFEPRGSTSSIVLQEACDAVRPGLLFDTSIPRTSVINDASLRGVVTGQGELSNAPAVAWTFEQLSAELLDRLRLTKPQNVLEDGPLF